MTAASSVEKCGRPQLPVTLTVPIGHGKANTTIRVVRRPRFYYTLLRSGQQTLHPTATVCWMVEASSMVTLQDRTMKPQISMLVSTLQLPHADQERGNHLGMCRGDPTKELKARSKACHGARRDHYGKGSAYAGERNPRDSLANKSDYKTDAAGELGKSRQSPLNYAGRDALEIVDTSSVSSRKRNGSVLDELEPEASDESKTQTSYR
ncbi:hypothetical protein H2202_011264 [Exophiala xenobiotica]|nr:hypothetical protein H2202_011264 [Exophiala xenobiotica]